MMNNHDSRSACAPSVTPEGAPRPVEIDGIVVALQSKPAEMP